MNIAGIDLGSNAARLLIRNVVLRGGCVEKNEKLLFVRVPLRLGDDVFRTGRVGPKKAENLLSLIRAYEQLMRIYDVRDFRATASSALRDAMNGRELIDTVGQLTGIPIEIISGTEEARLIYESHYEQNTDDRHNYLYVDVGGGSTEINLIRQGRLELSRSYNIGTIRSLHGGVTTDDMERLKHDMRLLVDNVPLHIVGSGGNINKLYRLMNKPKSRIRTMSVLELEQLAITLSRLTEEERRERYGLRPDRADVIVPAARIFLAIAKAANAVEIQVPVLGLADGLVDSVIRRIADRQTQADAAATEEADEETMED